MEEKSQLLEEKSSEVNQLKIQQETELQRIANLTEEQAREEIMAAVETDMAKDMAIYIRNKELESEKTLLISVQKNLLYNHYNVLLQM